MSFVYIKGTPLAEIDTILIMRLTRLVHIIIVVIIFCAILLLLLLFMLLYRSLWKLNYIRTSLCYIYILFNIMF